jgi:hypothetical protein
MYLAPEMAKGNVKTTANDTKIGKGWKKWEERIFIL